MHVANTLVYVRTEAGVAQVDPGQPVPESADADHLATLVAKGVVELAPDGSDTSTDTTSTLSPEGGADAPTPPSGSTGRSKGRRS